ncbi:hypothetical protein FRC04_000862 [Tulasnella sp. 424]|nr:hypothetical protein FRC04_000862 [Tulasnella sp. 424]
MSTPPWFPEDLPKGNWHADVDFLERAYDDLEDLARILHPDPLWEALDPVAEDKCDCGSVDGGDQSDLEEVEETYCPRRSISQPNFNRTFLILEQVLPRLRFAARKLNAVISKVTKRAQESRDRWKRRVQAEISQHSQAALRLERKPLEVLSSIIFMASQKDRRIPFTLSRVNTALRQLISYMPRIWANLDATDAIANTKIRIQRSQGAPLKLHMSIPPSLPDKTATAKMSRFIKLLEPERHRVQTIFIDQFYAQWMEGTLKPLKGSLVPSQIQELSLRRIFLYHPEGRLWTNLVRLSLADITVPLSKLQDDLLAMPALQVLVLDNVGVRLEETILLDSIVLPHLRYLVVKNSEADLITPILKTPNSNSTVLLPELEYLRIKGCDIEGDHLAALSGSESEAGDVENEHRTQFSACQRLEELVFENEMSIDSGTMRDIVEVRSALPESEDIKRVKWITFRGCDADLIKDEDVQAMAQLTKGIACDLLDGKEAWAEDLEESSAESGDGWDSSDEESSASSEDSVK